MQILTPSNDYQEDLDAPIIKDIYFDKIAINLNEDINVFVKIEDVSPVRTYPWSFEMEFDLTPSSEECASQRGAWIKISNDTFMATFNFEKCHRVININHPDASRVVAHPFFLQVVDANGFSTKIRGEELENFKRARFMINL